MHKIFGKKIETADYYHRPGAYLIPYRDGKIALVGIPLGLFLLGGGREEGESDEECILRECLEETGYRVKLGRFLCSAETYCRIPEREFFHPIQTYYTGQLLEKVQEPIETDHRLLWMPPEEAAEKLYSEQQRWAADCFRQSL